jgi:type IV pilus assembly protein PilB
MQEYSKIAHSLLKHGLITEEQLKYAKRINSKLPTPKPLLAILKKLELVTDETVCTLLKDKAHKIPLGSMLVELGLISHDDLEKALEIQKNQPDKRLGEILADHQIIPQERLYQVLSSQLKIPFLEIKPEDVEKSFFKKNVISNCEENIFIPVSRNNDGTVTVVFANPLDQKARRTATHLFGEIRVVTCYAKAILQTLQTVTAQKDKTAQAETGENKIVSTVDSLIQDALKLDVSDIHIEPTKHSLRIRYRLDGVLLLHRELPMDMAAGITSRIKIMAGSDIAERRRHQDGRILFGDENTPLDIRVSFYATVYGEKIVLRLLNQQTQLLDINSIGLAPKLLQRFKEDVLDMPSGVVLITGPTGSGKTTTLYSAIDYLNNIETSIITAEDPAEYLIDGISQCSLNPKINVTFEETLRHIVRQDPDVIVIGEIRDRFSAETAIQAALTGHKVLTTFHTEDTIGGLLRLLNMNIEAFLISSTVVSVLAQRLVRKICPICKEEHILTSDDIRRLGYSPAKIKNIKFWRGKGCSECRFTGYWGRLAVCELLVLNEEVKDAIISRKTSYEIRRISVESSGLVTLLEDGLVKAHLGQTTFKEIMRQLPRLDKPRPISQLKRIQGIT